MGRRGWRGFGRWRWDDVSSELWTSNYPFTQSKFISTTLGEDGGRGWGWGERESGRLVSLISPV